MTSLDPLYTEFAPVERKDKRDVEQQALIFERLNLLGELLDAVPVIMMILNQNRQMVYANRQLAVYTGAQDTRSLLSMRPGEILGCIRSSLNPGGCGTTRFCRECGAARAIISSLSGAQAIEECRILRDNAAKAIQALDLRVWTTPISVDDQHFVVFSLTDIAHEKRREALERVFFHDVLNSVGALQMAAELLPQPAADENLSTLDRTIQTTSRRIGLEIMAQKELLAAENRELSVRPEPLSAHDFVADLLATSRSLPAAKNRFIKLDETPRDIRFVSDAAMLGRVLGNMLKNALEACQPGETVTLTWRDDAGSLLFSVHNPGYIPENVQVQIFQRSFSTKGRGRGLGTYSMKLLSEQYLQGQVWFTTSPQAGTTFYCRIPLRLKTAEEET